MKKIFFLFVALVLVTVIQGCTRASNSDSAKIQIKLPNESSVLLPKATLNKNGGLADPTTLDEINCYGVFVGGPDEDLKGKVCALGSTNESFDNHSGGEMIFGDWKAAIPAGQTLSMEVKSGVDRVIYLVGMKTTDGACVDFKERGMPDDSKMSSAFLLGVAGRLELKAGAETTVQIPMSMNASKTIVGCRGDDILHDGGGDDGGGSNIPYLRFEGLGSYDSVLDIDKATVNECYTFRPSLFKGQGGAWVDAGGNDIHINVSGLSAGQFYSGFGCVTPITDLVIPAGQSKSITDYYFKATTAVSGTLANVVITGNTEEITGAQHKFDIGQRKIVVLGPNRIIVNECYPYKIASSRYEGGFLNTDMSGATGALTDNANFYLRTGSDCSAGTTASISPYMSEGTIHLKLMTNTTLNLANFITVPGYTVQNFLVDASARGDHYDALVARLRNDKFVRGECNDFNIHLVNNDGGSVKARHPIDVKIKAPQGAGVFYLGQSCVGGVVDVVQIPQGETTVPVSFRAHGIPSGMLTAGKLPLYIDSGSLKLSGIAAGTLSIAWVDVVDSNNSKVLLHPPNFNGANVVGSHEFLAAGSVLEIPLMGNYEGLVDVECSGTPGTGFSPCSAAEVDRTSAPYKYKWAAAAAAIDSQRYVRFKYASYFTNDVGISASKLYGPKFKVVMCSALASAGPLSNAAAMNAQVLCIPANTILSKSSITGYSINSTRHSIIGHSNGTSVLFPNGYSGSVIDFTSMSAGEDRFVANLKIDGIVSTANAVKLDNSIASATSKIYIDNLNISATSSSVRGIWITNMGSDPDLDVVIRNSKIDLTGVTSYGIYIESTNRVAIEDTEISAMGATSYGIKVYNASSMGGEFIGIRNSLVKVNDGLALGIYNSGSSVATSNDIRNSRFVRTGGGNGASEILRVDGKWLNSSFDGNILMAEPGAANSALAVFYQTGTPMTYTMIGNTFIQSSNSPGLIFDGTHTISEFSKNSFAYTGGLVNNGYGAVKVMTAVFSPSSSLGTDGGNIACGATSYVFSSFHVIASGGVSGNVSLGLVPVYPTNVVANTGRCRGP